MELIIDQDNFERFNESVSQLLDYIDENNDMLDSFSKQRLLQVAYDVDREW